MIYVFAYVASILAANVVTAATQPLGIGPFLVPVGTFLIGGTLVLRDAVQLRFGRKASYLALAVALCASAASSRLIGDPVAITVASAAAFLFSETAETEIFSRFRALLSRRIFWSGTVSGAIDSALFVTLGLSPLTTGFVPWLAVPLAIIGQYLVKTFMVALGAAVSLRVNRAVGMSSRPSYAVNTTVAMSKERLGA